jgi:hypothetical protein
MHVSLDKFYRGMVWHRGRGWNVNCFGMLARDIPSGDEAMEVVRMWSLIVRHQTLFRTKFVSLFATASSMASNIL